MYRLGAQLTLRSGREPLVRLIVTAVAVAAGVAIMLAVLADFNAFNTTSNRPAWENTQGHALTADYPSATHAELWNYGNDIYQGQTIERLDVAGLGPGAPVPPGISRLPGPGQYYASPALAALIRSVPADELGDRFPGGLIGTIGQRALTGPTELVAYVGYAPATLATRPATTLVSKINNGGAGTGSTPFFRGLFIVAAIMFLFPILILVGTATRLAAARREERYAALRLIGATNRQVATIASVEAAISGLIGTLLGIGLFAALQPALADSAITSARYFADEVTPTAPGYVLVLVGVPVASAIGALLSLRRVRISPLGVSRRVTPPPPTAWRIAPLAAGIVLFALGQASTSQQNGLPLSQRNVALPLLTGLIVIMIGVVVAGPWLTVQSARLLGRLASGPAPLLAARRLADNPKLAFRSVSGLVLAVFLGTAVGSALPAVEYTTATPRASALSNVLIDEFSSAPVCGTDANCTGGSAGPANPLAGPAAQRIANEGLPPQAAARLLAGLGAINGVTVFPIYSPKGSIANPAAGPPGGGIISCADLRELAVLGQCAPGQSAVVAADPEGMFVDNPRDATQPIVRAAAGWVYPQTGLAAPPGHGALEPASPAASGNFSGLYLQLVLVKVNNAATLEKVRTYLITHTPESASGTAPRTFGEALLPRAAIADTVQRLIDTAVILTLIVAGCSLAVSVGGSLVERKRPFTLLRVAGTRLATLYRVVLLETALPLAAATILAGSVAYLIATTTVKAIEPPGTPVPPPGGVYYATMAAGLAGALLVILTSLPLLRRLTAAAAVRFE
jgi:hypothetical protein